MKKQDRIFPRTPEAAVRESRAEMLKLSDSITLKVENGETTAQIKLKVGDKEIPATIDMKGLVTFTNLKTPGATEIDGGNITTGTILADLIKAGVLKSKDGKSLVIDLDNGRAEITGILNVTGEAENGWYVGSVQPGIVQLAHTDSQGNITRQSFFDEGHLYIGTTATEGFNAASDVTTVRTCLYKGVNSIVTELSDTEAKVVLTKDGTSILLSIKDGKARISGLTDPEDGSDAVNKTYLEGYVLREIDKLREELGLGVG